MVGNTALAYPDLTCDLPTILSGGLWSTALPLSNLKDRLIAKVARSANALATSTQWVEDLGSAREVGIVALLNHNISLAGTVRVRGYSNSGLTALVHDTGTLYAWPQTFAAKDVGEHPSNWILPLPTTVSARYWKVEIVDTTNVTGCVQAGRSWLGPVWKPEDGIVYGGVLGYEARSVITESLGGVPWSDQQVSRRAGTVTFPRLTDAERRTAMLFQKTVGNSGEVLYVENVNAAAEDLLLYAFPALVRQPKPIRAAAFNASELPMDLVELLPASSGYGLIIEEGSGITIGEAWSQAEQDAFFAEGCTIVVRMDLLGVATTTTTAAPTTTTTTAAPTTTTTTAAPTTTTTAAPNVAPSSTILFSNFSESATTTTTTAAPTTTTTTTTTTAAPTTTTTTTTTTAAPNAVPTATIAFSNFS